jgi:hypothetical protein
MNENVTIEGNKNKECASGVKNESSSKGMYIPTQLSYEYMIGKVTNSQIWGCKGRGTFMVKLTY